MWDAILRRRELLSLSFDGALQSGADRGLVADICGKLGSREGSAARDGAFVEHLLHRVFSCIRDLRSAHGDDAQQRALRDRALALRSAAVLARATFRG